MRKKLIAWLMSGIFVVSALTGCGEGKHGDIPYPDGYYIPKPMETESVAASSEENETISPVRTNEAVVNSKSPEIIKKIINFFLDTSGSMKYSPEVIKIHSAVTKCAAGYEERYFYGIDTHHNLVKTTEKLALSGKYGNGAPIDLIEEGTLPYDPDGVNVITTDLQTNTSCSEFGRWLVNSGCTGYSFYVFNMKYDGSLEFEMYTSNSTLETVRIDNCSFEKKEFLMIVFGNNDLVEDYDRFFQSKIDSEVEYDMCHVSLHDDEERLDSFLKLTSSKCFNDDIPNVDFNNTNFVYGLKQVDAEDTEFTCDNTFVYKKSNKSSNKAKQAIKAILYAVPEKPVPKVEKAVVTHVLEYNKETSIYEESKVTFQVDTTACLDGLPSAVGDPDSEVYERLNNALEGPIVSSGPVFAVTVQNELLPKGLYAVEVQVAFEAVGEVMDLRQFAASHNAGLEEYSAALQKECSAKSIDGQTSVPRFNYTGDGTDSAFCKLLEFEKVIDELIEAGAVTESNNEMITLRLIIDNR